MEGRKGPVPDPKGGYITVAMHPVLVANSGSINNGFNRQGRGGSLESDFARKEGEIERIWKKLGFEISVWEACNVLHLSSRLQRIYFAIQRIMAELKKRGVDVDEFSSVPFLRPPSYFKCPENRISVFNAADIPPPEYLDLPSIGNVILEPPPEFRDDRTFLLEMPVLEPLLWLEPPSEFCDNTTSSASALGGETTLERALDLQQEVDQIREEYGLVKTQMAQQSSELDDIRSRIKRLKQRFEPEIGPSESLADSKLKYKTSPVNVEPRSHSPGLLKQWNPSFFESPTCDRTLFASTERFRCQDVEHERLLRDIAYCSDEEKGKVDLSVLGAGIPESERVGGALYGTSVIFQSSDDVARRKLVRALASLGRPWKDKISGREILQFNAC